MLRQQLDPPSVHDGYTVHLTEHCSGWRIVVTRAGRDAAFAVHHGDPQRALAMAKTIAATERADLVVTAAGRGRDFVPATRVASYLLADPLPRG